ncbi:MAG: hypothetical protein EAZ55_09055 [Cytophagales bacterium]|nr:MAG: hypothetical protein EAZ55_09055 [Cytophagales bacterium]
MQHWIDTTGGPMILLPKRLLPFWSGCFSVKSIEAGDLVDLEDGDEWNNPETSDYAKVCTVCGNHKGQDIAFFEFQALQHLAITLWGDPKILTTIVQESSQKFFIVRNSNRDNGIQDLLVPEQLNRLAGWQSNGILDLKEREYVLFDACAIHFYLDEEQKIELSIEQGMYEVKTIYFDESRTNTFLGNADFYGIVHLLEKV